MDAKICIETRRSVRRFADAPVSREQIAEAVAVARMAPTWKNSQTVRYIWIDDPALKQAVAEGALSGYAKNVEVLLNAAGMMLVTTVHGISGYNPDGTPTTAKGDHWESFDAGIAVQTLCLALHEQGLGSVIMGLFDPDEAAKLAGVPEGQLVSCVLAVGVPAEGSHGVSRRKPVEELLSFR